MDNQATAIGDLSDDLFIYILIRVPIQSLLRLKCVSKSWGSLISSREFVTAHLLRCRKDSSLRDHKVILNCRGYLKQCSVSSLMNEPLTDLVPWDYSENPSRKSVWVVGSCDGLICLTVDRKNLILWNPSTRVCRTLPGFGVEVNSGGYFAYGLGYHKLYDDYKVVGFHKGCRTVKEVVGKIYSLRTNQWTSIQNFKGRWLMDDPAVFANGKLYWISSSVSVSPLAWDMVSLDLETEECMILPMPGYVESGYYSRMGVSEGNLYVLCSHLACADVWVMDEDSEHKETWSWTKVVTIPYVDDFLKYSYKRAFYVMKNGKVLLLCGSTFVIFDSRDCSFSYPQVRNSDEVIAAINYVETLVSPLESSVLISE